MEEEGGEVRREDEQKIDGRWSGMRKMCAFSLRGRKRNG